MSDRIRLEDTVYNLDEIVAVSITRSDDPDEVELLVYTTDSTTEDPDTFTGAVAQQAWDWFSAYTIAEFPKLEKP